MVLGQYLGSGHKMAVTKAAAFAAKCLTPKQRAKEHREAQRSQATREQRASVSSAPSPLSDAKPAAVPSAPVTQASAQPMSAANSSDHLRLSQVATCEVTLTVGRYVLSQERMDVDDRGIEATMAQTFCEAVKSAEAQEPRLEMDIREIAKNVARLVDTGCVMDKPDEYPIAKGKLIIGKHSYLRDASTWDLNWALAESFIGPMVEANQDRLTAMGRSEAIDLGRLSRALRYEAMFSRVGVRMAEKKSLDDVSPETQQKKRPALSSTEPSPQKRLRPTVHIDRYAPVAADKSGSVMVGRYEGMSAHEVSDSESESGGDSDDSPQSVSTSFFSAREMPFDSDTSVSSDDDSDASMRVQGHSMEINHLATILWDDASNDETVKASGSPAMTASR